MANLSMLPSLALSVRQPWAWAIIHAGKDIENRSWQAVNHGLKRRGVIAIHAAKGMTQGEYEDASDFIRQVHGSCPHPSQLERGGIIGTVEVVDVVTGSDSPWFVGPHGLVLASPKPCPFIPCSGVLGYFNWKERLSDEAAPLAKWMVFHNCGQRDAVPCGQGDLL